MVQTTTRDTDIVLIRGGRGNREKCIVLMDCYAGKPGKSRF